MEHPDRRVLRQLAATLAYRAAKVLRDVPPSFAHYTCGDSTRTPLRIVAHMADLMAWGTSIARAGWQAGGGDQWNVEVDRFFSGLASLDAALAADDFNGSADKLIQGPLADALTHVGQLAMMRGNLTVADLPGAFADGMQEMLGIRPPTTALGAMQDIHWADGLFGYFPTYTLGNLYAAQLAEAAEIALGGIDDAIASGEFGAILAFMRDRVHRHGARTTTRELMRAATGVELGSDALISHLRRSYLG
mgnify:CR=1 FL=1